MTTFLAWRSRLSSRESPTHDLRDEAADSDEFANSDSRSVVADALRALPARQRAAIVLRFYEDLTESMIAAEMGCSVGTVKTHLSRALQTLRAIPELTGSAVKEAT